MPSRRNRLFGMGQASGAVMGAGRLAERVRRTTARAVDVAGRKLAPGGAAEAGLFGRHPPAKAKVAKGRAKPGRSKPKRPAAKAKRGRVGPGGALDALGFFIAAGLIVAHAQSRRPHAATLAAVQERGRGRDAEHPLEIPTRGWVDILKRTWANFNSNRIMATAGGVTFFSLLAIFPALAAFVSLYGLFFDRHDVVHQLGLMRGFVPRDVLSLVSDQMTRLATTGSGKLGFAFAVSLLLSLWSGNGAIRSLFDGLNVAYEEKERRGFVRLTLVTLAFTLGAILFALVAIAAVVVLPVVLKFLHLGGGAAYFGLLRWPAILLVVALGLSVVYRYGPSRAQPRWRWITPGGLLAAVLWLAASLAFSWYVSNFANFNKTYGSLGAVVGFMTWLWYSTIIVLFGAELNAEIEHQTSVDTTVGGPRPLGTRGAAMADTVGEATA